MEPRVADLKEQAPMNTASHVHDFQRGLVTDLDTLVASQGEQTYREFLRVAAMSVGFFAASAGHDDKQQPHEQDEVYVVLAGRAVLDIDGTRKPVAAGSIAYVPARLPHRFTDIGDGLQVAVVFAPPENDTAAESPRQVQ
jgi:mannose-6-phosphate isomerase-like protein (cupin superfamily)